jgi:ATP-binding cassette subfamily F protein uup
VASASKGRVEKPVLGKEGAPKAARKLSYKLQRELDGLPAQLEAAEAKLAELQAAMSDSRFYEQGQDKIQAGLDAFAQQEKVVEVLMERWVELEAMQD